MSTLPAANYLSNGARTEGEVKVALEDIRSVVAELPGGSAESELTISSGSVTPTGGIHAIDTQGDAATDNLDNIAVTNTPDGRVLLIHPANDARVVVVRHNQTGSGEIYTLTGLSVALRSTKQWMLLRRTGGGSPVWHEVVRSNSGSLELIQTQSASNSAQIDFTVGIDATYDEYLITITDLIPATDGTYLYMRAFQSGTPFTDSDGYRYARVAYSKDRKSVV